MGTYYMDRENEMIITKTERERKHALRPDYDFALIGKYASKAAAEKAYIEMLYPELISMTEDMLLDHYIGVSKGFDYISDFDGRRYWWRYYGTDGYHSYDDRSNAECIIFTEWENRIVKKDEVPLSETANLDKVRKIEAMRDKAISKM